MNLIFPKKQVPFNNHEESYDMFVPKNTNPGPGTYKPDRSDFQKIIGRADKTFLLNDNGHINQRSQPYLN